MPRDRRTPDLRPQLRAVDSRLAVARVIGDSIVAAFFSANKPKKRIERLVDFQKAVQSHLGSSRWAESVASFSAGITTGEHPILPFHWQIEFPEVFARENSGFDAIVGNPPFAGKNTVAAGNRDGYGLWLQTLHEGAHGNADLVAHFFRRAFALLRFGGVFGLIATNTIGQGDTRASGLTAILAKGGKIIRAMRRLKWPGEATVVVSVVHVSKDVSRACILDGRPVQRISAYLVEGELDTSPALLAANSGKAFIGSYLLGMGFTFDDAAAAKGLASSLEEMRLLIQENPRNAERIFPLIGGDEVTSDPVHASHRYAVDFFDRPLGRRPGLKRWSEMTAAEMAKCRTTGLVPLDYPGEVAEDWPKLQELVAARVKPERATQDRGSRRDRWWQYAEKSPGLYRSISNLPTVLVNSGKATPHHAFARLPAGMIYTQNLNVFAISGHSAFCTLAARPHEIWARQFGTTFEDRLTYAIEECFKTFPFPLDFQDSIELEAAGQAYHDYRAALMTARSEGMTTTYNRFHDLNERSQDLLRLRDLHAEMDRAVLRAYGWNDLAVDADAIFLNEANEDDHAYQGRLFWPSDFRDEVLARLLALNAERAAAEQAAGLSVIEEGNGVEREENEGEAA